MRGNIKCCNRGKRERTCEGDACSIRSRSGKVILKEAITVPIIAARRNQLSQHKTSRDVLLAAIISFLQSAQLNDFLSDEPRSHRCLPAAHPTSPPELPLWEICSRKHLSGKVRIPSWRWEVALRSNLQTLEQRAFVSAAEVINLTLQSSFLLSQSQKTDKADSKLVLESDKLSMKSTPRGRMRR